MIENDFYLISGNWVDKFVDAALIKDLLPYEALSLLDIKHFSCLSAPKYLQEFLDVQLMTSDAEFQLSSQCFEHLLIQFLHHDFSVSNFSSGLHFAAFEHFRTMPLSFLCTNLASSKAKCQKLSKQEIQAINRLPSMEKCPVKSGAELTKVIEKHFDEEVATMAILRCLFVAQR